MDGRRNRRYKKTEGAILAVFFDNPNCTMRQLAKRAGVARSTIYTHHHSVREIVSDCEKIILAEYEIVVDEKMRAKKVEIRILYLDMLVLIIKNRQIFEIFLKFDDREVVMKMVLKLKPKIKESEKILRICASEITEIIFEWGKRGFAKKEVEKVLSDMMYLTVSARNRLGPIV